MCIVLVNYNLDVNACARVCLCFNIFLFLLYFNIALHVSIVKQVIGMFPQYCIAQMQSLWINVSVKCVNPKLCAKFDWFPKRHFVVADGFYKSC